MSTRLEAGSGPVEGIGANRTGDSLLLTAFLPPREPGPCDSAPWQCLGGHAESSERREVGHFDQGSLAPDY